MGPEILVAILGPVVGGSVTLFVWITKRNAEQLNTGLTTINTSVNVIERKIDDLRVDVAKNYVTNEDLTLHISGEEGWHTEINQQMASMRSEISHVRNAIDRIYFDDKTRG
jgi:prefoldin subunit 5